MSDSQTSLFPPKDLCNSWPFQPTVPLLPCVCVQLFNTLALQCSSTPTPYLWTPRAPASKTSVPLSQHSSNPARFKQVSTVTQNMTPILRTWGDIPLYNVII